MCFYTVSSNVRNILGPFVYVELRNWRPAVGLGLDTVLCAPSVGVLVEGGSVRLCHHIDCHFMASSIWLLPSVVVCR